MPPFSINPAYKPRADQPAAIKKLAAGSKKGCALQTLLGATGTGKTFTIAGVIKELQRPSLVIAPNKTLAAQLTAEFRELFPDNRVEYFVSYYDHYQPEAYVPHQDLFIEKDASINEDIDRLRHAATSAILERKDTIVVASVSCIYGIGSPVNYREQTLFFKEKEEMERDDLNKSLTKMQYKRNDAVLERGNFSWKGEVLEIWPQGRKDALRVRFFGDEIEKIEVFDPTLKEIKERPTSWILWPASHWVASEEDMERGIKEIKDELKMQLKTLKKAGKNLEAERLRSRTEYDLEMLEELGWTSGIENYSRAFDGRAAGEAPATLLDYFPDDFLVFLDESHQTAPQIGAMYSGDRARKQTLVDFGFRLPSALDNRPLKWEEFLERTNQIICMSATPGKWEKENSVSVAEQIVRPTGIIDPKIKVQETAGQIDFLLKEIKKRQARDERVLVTTLTKKMAEDLSEYLLKEGVPTRYLHSDVETLERVKTIRDLRSGRFDVLVGVNLLREGLDLPEVSLVAILDADKEGFLRGETALIQTIGRAARHPKGEVILFADKESRAMESAIKETERRQKVQRAFNKKHGLKPEKIKKGLSATEDLLGQAAGSKGVKPREVSSREDLDAALLELEEEMALAAEELRFEDAARLRDEIKELTETKDVWS